MQRHEEWFTKANSDLKISKKLLELEDDSILDGIVYHCQQAAEKTLKGFLSYKNHKIEKTHNLVLLVKFCEQYEKEFISFLEIAATLSPYSFKFRYPDDILLPDRKDAEIAVVYAQKILNFVKSKIEELESGQTSVF